MTLKRFLTPILSLLFCFFATSQIIKKQPMLVINYLENVNAPFTIKEIKILKEVYKDKFEHYIVNDDNYSKALKNLLRNRIVIHKRPEFKAIKKYKKRPIISLNSKTNLIKDSIFNKDLFNPLKYKIQLFSKEAQLFKIDNTDYYLIIYPQR